MTRPPLKSFEICFIFSWIFNPLPLSLEVTSPLPLFLSGVPLTLSWPADVSHRIIFSIYLSVVFLINHPRIGTAGRAPHAL
jgi:hypothetical protein